jgi:hypothetical protein
MAAGLPGADVQNRPHPKECGQSNEIAAGQEIEGEQRAIRHIAAQAARSR